MTDEQLLEKLSEILTNVLGEEPIVLTMETVRDDVQGWDSFNYVNFIVSIELEFDVAFSVSDLEAFENVGDIVRELKNLIG